VTLDDALAARREAREALERARDHLSREEHPRVR
jgi:hypothetical protein